MSILPGEGEHLILYGSFDLPAGTQMHQGYMARPNAVGSFPTVLVVHTIYGLTSHEKEVCRRLARRGLTAVALDLYRGRGPRRGATLEEALEAYHRLDDRRVLADLDDAHHFVMNRDIPGTQKEGLGLLGLDVGGRFALLYAPRHPTIRAVVVCYAPLSGEHGLLRPRQPLDVIGEIQAPVLGLYGQQDDLIEVRDVNEAQRSAPRGEWILYEGIGHDFLDEGRPGYDHAAAHDAVRRMATFFATHLPAPEIIPAG